MEKIALGSDHAGFKLKEHIKKYLLSLNYEVVDFGTDSEEPVDYPHFIIKTAEHVSVDKADYGIVFGGSGNGEAMAANKVKGIRCALCWNDETARLAKEHNNSNMISIGERLINNEDAARIVGVWLNSGFDGGRHLRRLQLISDYEIYGRI